MTPTANGTQRAARDPWDIGFGVVVLAFALISLLVWFPNDIRGGFIVTNQVGKPEPGDAFFPVILASLMGGLAACQILFAVFRPRPEAQGSRITADNFKFLAGFCLVVGGGLAVMYWLGPILVATLNDAGVLDKTYRQLTDAYPYKLIGYVVGGFLMTMALIARAEGRIRPIGISTTVLVIAALIFILDVLLYNIQLPPNADY
jgi:hypothetical protein